MRHPLHLCQLLILIEQTIQLPSRFQVFNTSIRKRLSWTIRDDAQDVFEIEKVFFERGYLEDCIGGLLFCGNTNSAMTKSQRIARTNGFVLVDLVNTLSIYPKGVWMFRRDLARLEIETLLRGHMRISSL